MSAQQRLYVTCCRGQEPIGRRRRDDERINVVGVHPRLIESRDRRTMTHLGYRKLIIGDPSLLDPGSLCDPLVRSFDQLLQILVGQHLRGCPHARREQARSRRWHGPYASARVGPESSRPKCSTIWVSTERIATLTALRIARAGVSP